MVSVNDIKGVFFLLVVSVVSAFAFNYWSDSGISLFGQWNKTLGVVSPMEKNSVVDQSREINELDSMAKIIDRQECIVIDVRPKDLFEQGHLPGARSIPIAGFDEVIADFFVKYSPGVCLVLYCSGRECQDSHRFAERLLEFGYTNVRVFSGGYAEWKSKGLKVDAG